MMTSNKWAIGNRACSAAARTSSGWQGRTRRARIRRRLRRGLTDFRCRPLRFLKITRRAHNICRCTPTSAGRLTPRPADTPSLESAYPSDRPLRGHLPWLNLLQISLPCCTLRSQILTPALAWNKTESISVMLMRLPERPSGFRKKSMKTSAARNCPQAPSRRATQP